MSSDLLGQKSETKLSCLSENFFKATVYVWWSLMSKKKTFKIRKSKDLQDCYLLMHTKLKGRGGGEERMERERD